MLELKLIHAGKRASGKAPLTLISLLRGFTTKLIPKLKRYIKGHWFAQLLNVTSGWQPGRRSCNHPDMSPPNAVAGDKHKTRLASWSSSIDLYQSNTRHQMCYGRMVIVYGMYSYGDNDNENFLLMLVAEYDMQWLYLISNFNKKSLQLKQTLNHSIHRMQVAI